MPKRKSYPPYWLKLFNGISTTNLRIYFTIILALGTAIDYWASGVAPTGTWLAFIGAIAGIDVAQFASKRATHMAEMPAKPGDVEKEEEGLVSTDIQELSQYNEKG